MNVTEEIEESNDEEKIENSSIDYGKTAAAIGKMKLRGIKFSLPDVNKSEVAYAPDLKTNTIVCGFRGTTSIGNQLIKEIIKNRPYTSIEDFIGKVKPNKTQMVSLIKSGAFDSLYTIPREQIMKHYIDLIADKKNKLTLQNMQMLIDKDLLPQDLFLEKNIYIFNKRIKKEKKGDYYKLKDANIRFYQKFFGDEDLEKLNLSEEGVNALLIQSSWDKRYKKLMEPVKKWLQNNQEEILAELNKCLYNEIYNKYASGNISKWEMDSLSFYYHDHELAHLNNIAYGIVDYTKLPNEPIVEKTFQTRDGKEIEMFQLCRIAGTVIDKDKNKGTVTILTTTGVVPVKVWKNQFANWDRRIFTKNSNGKKTIIEDSWFARGNKIIITGIRKDDCFIPKKYKSTSYPIFEKIISMDNGFITESITERAEGDN